MASNNSSSNSSSQFDNDFNGKPVCIILVLISIGTVVANGILLTAYFRYRRLHTAFNIFIVNVSIVDFSQALLVIPGNFTLFYLSEWPWDGQCVLCISTYSVP